MKTVLHPQGDPRRCAASLVCSASSRRFIAPLLDVALAVDEGGLVPVARFCSMPAIDRRRASPTRTGRPRRLRAARRLGIFERALLPRRGLAEGRHRLDATRRRRATGRSRSRCRRTRRHARATASVEAVRRRVKKAKAKGNALTNFSNFCLILIPWMRLDIGQSALAALEFAEVFGLLGCSLIVIPPSTSASSRDGDSVRLVAAREEGGRRQGSQKCCRWR